MQSDADDKFQYLWEIREWQCGSQSQQQLGHDPIKIFLE